MTEFVIRDEVTGISIGVVRENGWNTVNWSSGSWSSFGFGSGGSGKAAQTVDQNLDSYVLDRHILASENAARAALTARYINSLDGTVVVPGTGQTLRDIALENLDRLSFGYVIWDDTLGPAPTMREVQRGVIGNTHDLVPGMELRCFPAGTSITFFDGSRSEIQSIEVNDQVSVLDATSTGTVTQIFRNITAEWLEIVWTDPTTGAMKQTISTPGHRFFKPDGSFDRNLWELGNS